LTKILIEEILNFGGSKMEGVFSLIPKKEG